MEYYIHIITLIFKINVDLYENFRNAALSLTGIWYLKYIILSITVSKISWTTNVQEYFELLFRMKNES